MLDHGALAAACQLLAPSGPAALAAVQAATALGNPSTAPAANAAPSVPAAAAQRAMLDSAAAESEGARDLPLVSRLLLAGRAGHAGQLAAAGLVAAMVEDGQAEVGRQAAFAIAKDPSALAAVLALLPGQPPAPADAPEAPSAIRTGATNAPAAAVPGFAARCLALGGGVLRDLALHDSCRDQFLKKCAQSPGENDQGATDAPLAATFRFGKEDKANAGANLKKVRTCVCESARPALP